MDAQPLCEKGSIECGEDSLAPSSVGEAKIWNGVMS